MNERCEPWPKWKDPDVCLPIDDVKVLVVGASGEVHFGAHRYDYWLIFGHNTYETHDVKAWLDIPEAP